MIITDRRIDPMRTRWRLMTTGLGLGMVVTACGVCGCATQWVQGERLQLPCASNPAIVVDAESSDDRDLVLHRFTNAIVEVSSFEEELREEKKILPQLKDRDLIVERERRQKRIAEIEKQIAERRYVTTDGKTFPIANGMGQYPHALVITVRTTIKEKNYNTTMRNGPFGSSTFSRSVSAPKRVVTCTQDGRTIWKRKLRPYFPIVFGSGTDSPWGLANKEFEKFLGEVRCD